MRYGLLAIGAAAAALALGCASSDVSAAPLASGPQAAPIAADPDGAAFWGTWPDGANPVTAGKKIAANLLTRALPWTSQSGIGYQEACTAYGSMRFDAQIGDRGNIDKIAAHYGPMLTDAGKVLVTTPQHVDASVMGILPLEIYVRTASPAEKQAALAAVNKLPLPVMKAASSVTIGRPRPDRGAAATAQSQWTATTLTHQEQETAWLTMGKGHADAQWSNPQPDGLTDQTRYWVDDMFMVIALQCQAYRATGDKTYLDRAAKEMVAYLDKLQQPNGLFFHADNARFYWSRGNGWFAVGMTELLSDLPADHPQRGRIMDSYKKMMAGLLKFQAADGMWRQLIDVPEAWDESSGTGMFTFALARGIRNGWLPEADYKDAAKKGWTALSSHITPDGQVTDVCEGTGAGTGVNSTVQYYLNRRRITGDYHGQAAYVWAAWAMIAPGKN